MREVNAMPFTNRLDYCVEEVSMEEFLAAMQQREQNDANEQKQPEMPLS